MDGARTEPVPSRIMTTSEREDRCIPPSMATAPINAYGDGSTHLWVTRQAARQPGSQIESQFVRDSIIKKDMITHTW